MQIWSHHYNIHKNCNLSNNQVKQPDFSQPSDTFITSLVRHLAKVHREDINNYPVHRGIPETSFLSSALFLSDPSP